MPVRVASIPVTSFSETFLSATSFPVTSFLTAALMMTIFFVAALLVALLLDLQTANHAACSHGVALGAFVCPVSGMA